MGISSVYINLNPKRKDYVHWHNGQCKYAICALWEKCYKSVNKVTMVTVVCSIRYLFYYKENSHEDSFCGWIETVTYFGYI